MRTWTKHGRGKQSAEQARTFKALMDMVPKVPVHATLHTTYEPMEVRLGEHLWTIYVDGYARPGRRGD